VQVPNTDGVLMAGMFAQVHLKLKPSAASVMVPANTLIVRGTGVFVATVDQDSKIQLRKVTLGRDFGSTVEVQSGLEAGVRVVPSPSDALADGMTVEVSLPSPAPKS
jgi:multidrug efflux pump subunit AcrA (membrane-fusion protein)